MFLKSNLKSIIMQVVNFTSLMQDCHQVAFKRVGVMKLNEVVTVVARSFSTIT